jgi:hypothetical protein
VTTLAPGRLAARRLGTRRQVALLLAVDVVAIAIILIGAERAAAVESTDTALGWFVVSMIGLGVSGLAHGTWISGQRRAVRSAVLRLPAQVRPVVGRAAESITPPGAATALVAVPRSLRYHRADCALAHGRELVNLSADDETLAARYPCEVCQP